MKELLARWNKLPAAAATAEILPCCGSRAWAEALVARRPIRDEESLSRVSEEIWRQLPVADWTEAFESHPRIGESAASIAATEKSKAWSTEEQGKVSESAAGVKSAFEQGNREYEKRFGRILIVCASGRSPSEILEILRRRLQNDDAAELREAADEQQRITQIRLGKWLSE